tara:strand:+ start:1162 stop:1683 length:522 start_codon:yes stop_codon:yes gene_type:complete
MLTTTQTIILSLLKKNLNKDCIIVIINKHKENDKNNYYKDRWIQKHRLFSSEKDIEKTLMKINNDKSIIDNHFRLLLDINHFKDSLLSKKINEIGYILVKDISLQNKKKLVNYLSKENSLEHICRRLESIVLFNTFIENMSEYIVKEDILHEGRYYECGIYYDEDMKIHITPY